MVISGEDIEEKEEKGFGEVTTVYTNVKINQTIQLRLARFNICKLYFSKKEILVVICTNNSLTIHLF